MNIAKAWKLATVKQRESGCGYLLIGIPIELLVTYPRQHLSKYLPGKHWISNIYNFLCNFLILPTLAIIPFRL